MRVLPRVKRRWRWLAAFIFLLWLAVLAADRLWPLPLHDVTPARVVVAEDGTPLWRFADAQGVWRYPVTLADVSPRYLQALIQYEDRWFWRHPGVNPFAVLRAAWQDLTSGRVISGGSTLTMQVARLLDPHPRTFGGKLRQLWRALQLEWHLSKSDILTLYLNRAPFGGTLQGIGAASWAYLGKPPARLSYGEAAMLAVLPQAPSRLRPDRWPQRAQAARDKVLTRMVSQGVWPEQAVKEAMEEPVWLFPRQMPQLAPLFHAARWRPVVMKGGDDSGCRTAAATGRSGAELEIAPAAAQFAGGGRRRPHGYESSQLGGLGGYHRRQPLRPY